MTRSELDKQIWNQRTAMYRLAWSILRHPQQAEDAVSAAVLQAYRKAETLRDETRFKPWLMRVTANTCYDLLRKEKRERDYAQSADFSQLFITPRENSLLELIGLLPPDVAQVLVLFYYEGFSTSEIARALGLSGAAVRARLSRGRKRLRLVLEEGETE